MKLQCKVGGIFLLRLNIWERPIVNKYCEGKLKRTLERELKAPETCVAEGLTKSLQAQVEIAELWESWLGKYIVREIKQCIFSSVFGFLFDKVNLYEGRDWDIVRKGLTAKASSGKLLLTLVGISFNCLRCWNNNSLGYVCLQSLWEVPVPWACCIDRGLL